MVIFGGALVRRDRKITIRPADPRRDVDLEGCPVREGQRVFVHIRDCSMYEDEEGWHIYTRDAPAIPVIYDSPFSAMGAPRKDPKHPGYVTRRLFIIRNGRVYSGVCRRREERSV